MKKLLAKLIVTMVLVLATVLTAYSQMPIPIGPGDGDNNTTPIGGMAVLAALGGGYAIKKLRGKKDK